jgi:RimJ/RimL family protein N-acetyltransferase
MIDRIALNEPMYGRIIGELSGVDYHPTASVNFARVIDDEFLGGVLFSDYTGESIHIHTGSVAPMWINRDMLYVAFDYPFRQLEVSRIFAPVMSSNEHALRFVSNVGFNPIARIDGMYPDNVASIIMCMEREDCRYLNLKPRTLHPGATIH